jgi:Glycosyl hydrolases family 16
MRPEPTVLFSDDFDEPLLNLENWFPYYLPHWSIQERAKARYQIQDSYLHLSIEDDQLPWCPEFDGDVKVSNLQTGHWSGPIGSSEGQHRFRRGLLVREALQERRLFLPRYCRLDMRARARLNPWNLAALWLIGFEDCPKHSGEITVFEVFGHGVETDGVKVGRGIKKIHDPKLIDELDEAKLPIKINDWHIYSMNWTLAGIEFLVDGSVVTTTRQSPDYPMQLMLNFYDLPGDHDRSKPIEGAFEIDYLRAWACLD